MTDGPAEDLLAAWKTALDRANPYNAVCAALGPPPEGRGRIVVVGAGKASARMAEAVESVWPVTDGLVVVPPGYGRRLNRCRQMNAGHPVPDAMSKEAARRALALANSLREGDTLVACFSGGGSALMSLPVEGVSADDKRAVIRALVRAGTRIQDLNAVRIALSAIKGGRLAEAAAPARVMSLLVSDVVGDDPGVIASGPTIRQPHLPDRARKLLTEAGIAVPDSVARVLDVSPVEDASVAAPDRESVQVVIRPMDVLRAVAAQLSDTGYRTLILGDSLEGDSHTVGTVLAGMAHSVAIHGEPIRPPAALISGGETNVTVAGNATGRGGRNTAAALGFALAAERLGLPAWGLFADTDGIDGASGAAGGIIDPGMLARARANGASADTALANADSASFLDAGGGLFRTAPTGTNVNDLRVVLIPG